MKIPALTENGNLSEVCIDFVTSFENAGSEYILIAYDEPSRYCIVKRKSDNMYVVAYGLTYCVKDGTYFWGRGYYFTNLLEAASCFTEHIKPF